MRFHALTAGAAVMSTLASAASPIRLAPSTQWVVDYAADSCRLIRHFGQGKEKTLLAFESEAPGALDMLIVGKQVASSKEQVPAKFLPVQAKPMLGLPGETTNNGEPMVLWSTVSMLPDDVAAAEIKKAAERRPSARPPALSLAEEAAKKAQRHAFAANITEIEIDARSGSPLILETGSLGAAIDVFDQCTRDSLRDWGVDPDLEDKIVRPVWSGTLRSWFKPSDYPKDMLMRGQQSDVKVRVLVDAAGRVTKCTSISHFKEAAFNKIVCEKFMERVHFEPAELADGTKVPSYYVNKVIFRIEP